MKNKIKIIVGLVLLGGMFFAGTDFVSAGCCVNTVGAECVDNSSSEDCILYGAGYYYEDKKCSDVGSCPSDTKDESIPKPNAGYITITPGCCVIGSGSSVKCTPGISGCIGKPYIDKNCSEISECNKSKNATTATSTLFISPLGSVTTVSQLLSNILNNLRGILVIIAVTFIVLGGIMYMMSGGNETMVTRAKKIWTGALIGLAIALAAPTFLKQIQIILGGNSGGESADAWVSNALTIRQIAMNILDFLLSVFGIIAIIAMIIGGGMYLTAYGDEKRIDTAKKILTYAILGTVVSLSAVVVIRQIGSLIGG